MRHCPGDASCVWTHSSQDAGRVFPNIGIRQGELLGEGAYSKVDHAAPSRCFPPAAPHCRVFSPLATSPHSRCVLSCSCLTPSPSRHPHTPRGAGQVFLGLNERTGELMAVKQMKINAGDERAMHIAALEREIVLYRRMRHRHIVGYIDMEKDPSDGSIYIFLEFVSGGSIHSMLEKFGKFSESLVRVYTRQLLLGLEYLHRCKIIHRDIKGGNVLVDRDGVIKLADFGASKVRGRWARGASRIRGSVFWMAPEVITGAGYGRKADIWSLGCTVIEMLTGRCVIVCHPQPVCLCATLILSLCTAWHMHACLCSSPAPVQPPMAGHGQHVVGHIPHSQDHHGPAHPEESSEEGRDFLAACFQLDPALRPPPPSHHHCRSISPWLACLPHPTCSSLQWLQPAEHVHATTPFHACPSTHRVLMSCCSTLAIVPRLLICVTPPCCRPSPPTWDAHCDVRAPPVPSSGGTLQVAGSEAGEWGGTTAAVEAAEVEAAEQVAWRGYSQSRARAGGRIQWLR
ncbi:unnamed protein product [Closterium sp. NIES-65]|nr:unnamed protein product [Closterium sp. NIES-65]